MTADPVHATRIEALSVAMRAKVNDLPKHDVELMMTRAEEALDSADPMFRAISSFAVDFELNQYDAGALYDMGRDLHRSIAIAMMPDPVDAGRSDIHG